MNSSTFGLGGEVAKSVQSGNAILPPTAMYFSAVVKKVIGAKPNKIKVELDGHVIYDGPAHNIFFCNGRYSGGGMLWSPKGKLDDGLLDVILIRDLSRAQLLTLAPRLFTGTLSSVPGISLYTVKTAQIVAQKKLWLELDGEAYHTQSVQYSVMDKALSLLVN
jgi:diacylglycerol kinase family enzyme